MIRSSKLPKDPNQLAAAIVKLSTEEPDAKPINQISAYLAAIGRKGGLKGGKARAAKLTSKRRQEIAKKAAESRWAKRKKR